MATLESVEKLKERANVSYDEARAALDACNDDLLEAVIYLENKGKVQPPPGPGYYSTQNEQKTYNTSGPEVQDVPGAGQNFRDAMGRIKDWFVKILHKGNTNHFEVWRQESRILTIPITLLVILVVCFFWVSLILLVVGLFCGCRYRFRGPEMEGTKANNVMDSAANAADNLKNEILNHEQK